MESKARRTLVKSAPELWQVADDLVLMETWSAGLVGAPKPVRIQVTDREPERIIAWRATDPRGGDTRIAIELAEKGFGTAVSITAQHSPGNEAAADAALEDFLDELGSPGRRHLAAD